MKYLSQDKLIGLESLLKRFLSSSFLLNHITNSSWQPVFCSPSSACVVFDWHLFDSVTLKSYWCGHRVCISRHTSAYVTHFIQVHVQKCSGLCSSTSTRWITWLGSYRTESWTDVFQGQTCASSYSYYPEIRRQNSGRPAGRLKWLLLISEALLLEVDFLFS